MSSVGMKAIFCTVSLLCIVCSSFITNLRNRNIAHRYAPLSLATMTSNPWDDIMQKFFVKKDATVSSSQKSAFRSIAITGVRLFNY